MITSFTGEYWFLSNFYMCDVYYEGILYPSSEHAYAAAKTTDDNLRMEIANIRTPDAAKKFGRIMELRDDWDAVKINVMREILNSKFYNRELMTRLRETAPAELIEGNTWGDTVWGQCPLGVGHNWLGKLLMEIRDDIT